MLSTPHLTTAAASKGLLGLASRQIPQVAAASATARGFSSTAAVQQEATLLQDKANGFGFARNNPRPPKPRTNGVTEIRGPYYSVCSYLLPSMLRNNVNVCIGDGKALPCRCA